MVDQDVGSGRLYIAGLAPLYARLAPLSYPLMRCCLGLMLVPHGFGKLFLADLPHTVPNMVKMGLPMPVLWAYWIGILEFFGGLLLAVGLFTRIVAAMIAVEMAVICFFVLWPNYGWTNRGIEYPLMMGIFALAMFLRGGGPLSLDRRIGREF